MGREEEKLGEVPQEASRPEPLDSEKGEASVALHQLSILILCNGGGY